ncbi:MAG: PEP-CTERM sorting domain-containing protein [Planctomycetes bacterium]|nr:PEP-CTERM sorting domain-containing protein [Planctomycetota bacterium]
MGAIPIGTIAFVTSQHSRIAMRRMSKYVFALLVFALSGVFSTSAHAVVVGPVNDTNVNPADYVPAAGLPDWDEGDPGWRNVTQSGSNFAYLGDNWVLTARHISAGTATFDTGSFAPVTGQNFIISNPPASMAGGASLTTQTDLRLFRISGTPNLPALTVASESPLSSGNSGSQIMFIGQGRLRATNETQWSMNLNNPPPNWTTAEVTSGGNVHGYKTLANTRSKRFGTNRLADPSSSEFGSNTFTTILSSTTAVLPLETADGITRDVISMVTRFDRTNNGVLPFEAQAVGEDSGGAVFYNRGTAQNPDWVLAGIVNATLIYGNQPRTYAVYGNSTTFADLSYYNQPYKLSICDIMKTCGNYSIMGDVNLDGLVTGNGTGLASDDDVSAFVEGWGFNNLAGRGDYDSWTNGDLNLDGQTNVSDFLLLRGALNAPIASGAMQALFGAGVPEPSSAMLAMLAAASLAFRRRRRAGR